MPRAASTLLRVAAAAALLGAGAPAVPLGADRAEREAEAAGWRGEEDVARAFAAARAQAALVLVDVWAPW